jgi:hypothetical protein
MSVSWRYCGAKEGKTDLDKQCEGEPDVRLLTSGAQAPAGVEVDFGGEGAGFEEGDSQHLGMAHSATELAADQRGQAMAEDTVGQTYVSRVPKGEHCAGGVVEISEGIALLGCWQLNAEEGATACAELGGGRDRRLGGEIGDVGREQGQEEVLVLRWGSHDGGCGFLDQVRRDARGEVVREGKMRRMDRGGMLGRLTYAGGGCCGGESEWWMLWCGERVEGW